MKIRRQQTRGCGVYLFFYALGGTLGQSENIMRFQLWHLSTGWQNWTEIIQSTLNIFISSYTFYSTRLFSSKHPGLLIFFSHFLYNCVFAWLWAWAYVCMCKQVISLWCVLLKCHRPVVFKTGSSLLACRQPIRQYWLASEVQARDPPVSFFLPVMDYKHSKHVCLLYIVLDIELKSSGFHHNHFPALALSWPSSVNSEVEHAL